MAITLAARMTGAKDEAQQRQAYAEARDRMKRSGAAGGGDARCRSPNAIDRRHESVQPEIDPARIGEARCRPGRQEIATRRKRASMPVSPISSMRPNGAIVANSASAPPAWAFRTDQRYPPHRQSSTPFSAPWSRAIELVELDAHGTGPGWSGLSIRRLRPTAPKRISPPSFGMIRAAQPLKARRDRQPVGAPADCGGRTPAHRSQIFRGRRRQRVDRASQKRRCGSTWRWSRAPIGDLNRIPDVLMNLGFGRRLAAGHRRVQERRGCPDRAAHRHRGARTRRFIIGRRPLRRGSRVKQFSETNPRCPTRE